MGHSRLGQTVPKVAKKVFARLDANWLGFFVVGLFDQVRRQFLEETRGVALDLFTILFPGQAVAEREASHRPGHGHVE